MLFDDGIFLNVSVLYWGCFKHARHYSICLICQTCLNNNWYRKGAICSSGFWRGFGGSPLQPHQQLGCDDDHNDVDDDNGQFMLWVMDENFRPPPSTSGLFTRQPIPQGQNQLKLNCPKHQNLHDQFLDVKLLKAQRCGHLWGWFPGIRQTWTQLRPQLLSFPGYPVLGSVFREGKKAGLHSQKERVLEES